MVLKLDYCLLNRLPDLAECLRQRGELASQVAREMDSGRLVASAGVDAVFGACRSMHAVTAKDCRQMAAWCENAVQSIVLLLDISHSRFMTDPLFLSALRLVVECQAKIRLLHLKLNGNGTWDVQYNLYSVLKSIGHAVQIFFEDLSSLPSDSDGDYVMHHRIDNLRSQLDGIAVKDREPSLKRKRSRSKSAKKKPAASWQLIDLVYLQREKGENRVVFTDHSLKTSKDITFPVGPRVKQAFESLSGTLWNLYFDSRHKSRNIEYDYYQTTGFKLALREKRLTKRNKQLMRMRQVEWNGKFYDMLPHIKIDCGSRHLRIYFSVDHEKRLIVVGHCGPHIETAGARFCR